MAKTAVASSTSAGKTEIAASNKVTIKKLVAGSQGSTVAAERKKIDVCKKRAQIKRKKRIARIYREPKVNSIQFNNFKSACDQALFYRPKRILDAANVTAFVKSYFKGTPELSDKDLLKEVKRTLKKGAEGEEAAYEELHTMNGERVVRQYRLTARSRSRVKTFIPSAMKNLHGSKRAGANQPNYLPPAFVKRTKKSKTAAPAAPVATA
jgi:hypothetical protein